MIIQIIRLSSSAALPVSAGAVVVVVAWAPWVPSPGTSRFWMVVNVALAAAWGAAGAAASSSPTVVVVRRTVVGGAVGAGWDGSGSVGGGSATVVSGTVVGGSGGSVVGGSVVRVVGGPGWAAATVGMPRTTASATAPSTTAVARRGAGRVALVRLPSTIHSTLSAPAWGERTVRASPDCRTLAPRT